MERRVIQRNSDTAQEPSIVDRYKALSQKGQELSAKLVGGLIEGVSESTQRFVHSTMELPEDIWRLINNEPLPNKDYPIYNIAGKQVDTSKTYQAKTQERMAEGQSAPVAIAKATGELALDEPVGFALKPVFLAGGLIIKGMTKNSMRSIMEAISNSSDTKQIEELLHLRLGLDSELSSSVSKELVDVTNPDDVAKTLDNAINDFKLKQAENLKTLPGNQLVEPPKGDITDVLYKKIDEAGAGGDLVKAKEFASQYVNDIVVLEGKAKFYAEIKASKSAKQLRAVVDKIHAEVPNIKIGEPKVPRNPDADLDKLSRELMNFWKERQMINKTMVTDVKKSLGLYDIPDDTAPKEAWEGLVHTKAKYLSYKNMTPDQKKLYIEELNRRVNRNIDAGIATVDEANPEKAILETLNATPERLASRPKPTKETRTIAEGALKLTRTIASRLWDIHPKLKAILRTIETDKIRVKKQLSEVAHPVARALERVRNKSVGVPGQENLVLALDQALFMSNRDLAIQYAEKLGIRKEIEVGLALGDKLDIMLRSSGERFTPREDYWARKVKDHKGLVAYMMDRPEYQGFIQEALHRRRVQLGRDLDVAEKMDAINMAMRGYLWEPGKQIYVPANFVKGRKVPVITMDMLPFYEKPEEALITHINDVLSKVAFNKIWGKDIPLYGPDITENSVGAAVISILEDLAKSGKTLTWEQQEILREQLKAEFMPKLPGYWTQGTMNMSYASELSDSISAMSNLGEYATMVWKDGVFNVAKAHMGKKITVEEAGLEPLIQEMENAARSGKSAKFLDTAMRMGGFRWMDVAMKNLNLTSSFHKLASKAKNPVEFTKYIEDFGLVNFDRQTLERVRGELLGGAKGLSEEGWQLILSDLADKQRVLPSGSTYAYARGGNTRIFQLFKGQPILIMNMIADESINAFKHGDKARGIRLALSGMFALYIAGAGPDVLRKYIRTGEVDWNEELKTNMARMFFLNSYALDVGYNRGNFITSLISGFATPSLASAGDAIVKGVKDAVDKGDYYPEQAIRKIPVIGDPLYYGKSIYDRTGSSDTELPDGRKVLVRESTASDTTTERKVLKRE